MKSNQPPPDQIITILDQAATGAQSLAAICRKHGIAETTFSGWCQTFSGMPVNEARHLTELGREDSRLKRWRNACWNMTCVRCCN